MTPDFFSEERRALEQITWRTLGCNTESEYREWWGRFKPFLQTENISADANKDNYHHGEAWIEVYERVLDAFIFFRNNGHWPDLQPDMLIRKMLHHKIICANGEGRRLIQGLKMKTERDLDEWVKKKGYVQ